MKRRDFVKSAFLFGAGLAFGVGDAWPSGREWRERRDLYPEGVASGDPDPHSILLWTRRPPVNGDTAKRLTVEVSEDEQFTRVRVRTTVLPMLEHELGPGVARTLARTADQLRADTSYLDAVSDAALAEAVTDGGLAIERLSRMDVAVRGRVLRLTAMAAGSPPGELFHEHVVAVDRLVMQWHGQKGVDLPGHVRALRAGDVLGFERGLNR